MAQFFYGPHEHAALLEHYEKLRERHHSITEGYKNLLMQFNDTHNALKTATDKIARLKNDNLDAEKNIHDLKKKLSFSIYIDDLLALQPTPEYNIGTFQAALEKLKNQLYYTMQNFADRNPFDLKDLLRAFAKENHKKRDSKENLYSEITLDEEAIVQLQNKYATLKEELGKVIAAYKEALLQRNISRVELKNTKEVIENLRLESKEQRAKRVYQKFRKQSTPVLIVSRPTLSHSKH